MKKIGGRILLEMGFTVINIVSGKICSARGTRHSSLCKKWNDFKLMEQLLINSANTN